MENRMRAVVVTQPGKVQVEQIDTVEILDPHEVLIKSVINGVCGSDVHAVQGKHPFVPLPYRPGHEVVGVVQEVGEKVSGWSPGDRVIIEPTLPCWECKMCRSKRSNLCENLQFFGCGYHQGGMADFLTIPANRLHRIPADLDDLQAVLIEPLATPVHAVRLSGDLEGKTVAILGTGAIGLLVLAAVQYAGAKTVVMTDMLPEKRERGARLGAHAVFDAANDRVVEEIREYLGESVDVVFDCVAFQATIDQACALATKGGTVMVVGVPEQNVQVPLPMIQDHQMRIQGSATYLPEDYETAIEIIRSGNVHVKDFITSRFSLDQAADAFEVAQNGTGVKTVIETSS